MEKNIVFQISLKLIGFLSQLTHFTSLQYLEPNPELALQTLTAGVANMLQSMASMLELALCQLVIIYIIKLNIQICSAS